MKGGSESNSQRLEKDVKRLRGLEYIPKAHVDFFQATAKAHEKAKDRLAEDQIYPAVSKQAAQEMLSEGFPLVSFDRMRVKIRPLKAHLKEISNILMKYEESKRDQIEAFCESEEYKKLDLEELVSKTMSHDTDYLKQLSEKTGVDESTLRFMAIMLARPLFELAAGGMKDMLQDYSWWKNYCPVCGSEPVMAKIRKGDNMRILSCSLCGTEWKFDRLTCPFCSNKNQKSLKFFYYHEESPHRVYVCDKCKRYIKCIDERQIEAGKETNFHVEDMATLYLDTLAREKGYVSG